jgi:hypothetical protein
MGQLGGPMFIKWIVFASFIFVLTNCTRSVENQKVSIVLPQNTKMKTFAPESSSVQLQSTTSAGSPFGMGSVFDVADVNCYMLLVDDPAGEFGNLKCKNEAGVEKRFLRGEAGISASGSGQKIELFLPTGTKRKLHLYGVKADAGTCIPPKQDPNAPMGWTRPRLLSSVEVELKGGEQTTTMQLPTGDVSGKEEFVGCELEVGMQPIADIEDLETSFGSGRDGDLTISTGTSIDLSTTTNVNLDGNSVYLSKTFKVESLESLDGKRVKVNANLGSNPDYLLIGDLVLFHIPAANDGTNGPDAACGPGHYRGKYSYARVMGIDTDIVTLDRPMLHKNAYTAIGQSSLNSRLSAAANDSTDFCRISMVRVPEFRNIIFQPDSTSNRTIKSADFDSVNYVGGILAFKVSESILLDDTYSGGNFSAVFSMRSKGFNSGNAALAGAGIRGVSSAMASASNGGDGASANGGGGGSNAGLGNNGDGPTSYGAKVGPQVGAAGGVVIPARDRKLFHGGQGGGVTGYSGLAGGGIIIAQIRDVNLNVNSSANSLLLEFDVAGASTGSNAAGAGAGGTAFVSVKAIHNNVYSQNQVKLYAKGGQNSNSGVQGGAGGAGMVELQFCNEFDVKDGTGSTLIESATIGTTGGPGGGEFIPSGAPEFHLGDGGFTLQATDPKPFYCDLP